MANPGRLKGQVAWISGAASGIGEATARLFAAEGAGVILADVQAARGRQLLDEIHASGARAVFTPCDVTQENQIRQSLEQGFNLFGKLSILVNCAGIVEVRTLQESTVQDWDRVMAINVRSIFLSLKHAIPFLRKNRRSYVVNVGSISSFVAQKHTPAYIASKGAVLQLSRAIAVDYAADGLRCNCVCPGITDTPMLRFHINQTPDPQAAMAQRLRRVPMNIALSPGDIAKSVLYFACEDSSGITGTSLIVDAGYLAAAEWDAGGMREA